LVPGAAVFPRKPTRRNIPVTAPM